MEFTRGDGDNVNTGAGYGGAGWWGGIWIFALVILALFFLWGRDDRGRKHEYSGVESIAPALALGAFNQAQCRPACGYGNGFGGGENLWDIERDMMREFATQGREFGEVRKDIMQTGWNVQKDAAQYFYEGQKTNLLGFKDGEIQGLRNTGDIIRRIDALEARISNDRMRQLECDNTQLKTVLGVRGLGAVPSYPACPPMDGCNNGYAYGYSY